MAFLSFSSILYPLLSQSLIYLNSVQLMSIMDHFGYTTRPLVEFNLDIYTDRASLLGVGVSRGYTDHHQGRAIHMADSRIH